MLEPHGQLNGLALRVLIETRQLYYVIIVEDAPLHPTSSVE
jgi:hypothetical protein